MHKTVVLEKQLPTAAASCFSTILSSSSTIFNLFSSLWWLKIHRFPLGFSVLLKIGRFLVVLCEKVMEDHVKNSERGKQLPAAAASCFFKLNPTFLHLFHTSFFIFCSFVSIFHFFHHFWDHFGTSIFGPKWGFKSGKLKDQKCASRCSQKQNREICPGNEREARFPCIYMYNVFEYARNCLYKLVPKSGLGLASPPRLGASPHTLTIR